MGGRHSFEGANGNVRDSKCLGWARHLSLSLDMAKGKCLYSCRLAKQFKVDCRCVCIVSNRIESVLSLKGLEKMFLQERTEANHGIYGAAKIRD